MADDKESSERRNSPIVRFLLENVGGFLALAGVLFAGGITKATLDAVAASVVEVKQDQRRIEQNVQSISVDVAVVKSKIDAIEKNNGRPR